MIRRRWRVRVCEAGDYGRSAYVNVTRRRFSRFYQHGIHVAHVDLMADDAFEQLADAQARARELIGELRVLETS